MKSEILEQSIEKGISTLTEYEAKQVLREYGIPCPNEFMIENGDMIEKLSDFEAKDAGINYPLYMKISSRDILHKTDAKVIAKASSDSEIVDKGRTILENAKKYNKDAKIEGILLSEDVSGEEKRELIVGSVLDEQFGHVVSLGIGGVSVEVYEDVEFRAVPLERRDVFSMVENLKGRKMLQEFRGNPPVDMDSLVETVLKVSEILEENEEIEEIDINPLFVGPEGTVAADALITLTH